MLPETWATANLGLVADVRWGNTSLTKASYVEQGFPAYSASGCDGFLPDYQHNESGIVLSAIGARCGKCFRADGRWTAIKNTITIVPQYVDREFLFRFINNEKIWNQRGGAQPFITLAAARELQIPLPPLLEQRRIVAKLEVLTAYLARARAELTRVTTLTETLRLSILRAAFQWHKADSDLRNGWTRKSIKEIGLIELGRQRSPKDHVGPHMHSYLRAANITWKGLDLSDVKQMNFDPSEFKVFCLRPGDVLLNEGSGSPKEVGKPAVWKGELDNVCFQNTLLRVRPHSYDPDLLRYCLLYVALSGQFIENTKGVNIIHIGKAGLSKTLIPVPPIKDQKRLLEQIEISLARVDRMQSEAANANSLLDRLETALLFKAFHGELLSQDSGDEPASLFLERIEAERVARPTQKRGRRGKQAAEAGSI